MNIGYLDDIAYEIPDVCPLCNKPADYEKAERRGPHIGLQCKICGGWTWARQCKEKNWAKLVKNRTNWKCERCGKPVQGRAAHAHHLIPVKFMPERQHDINNGICLCTECHKLIHGAHGTITGGNNEED